jgi:arylsulfatase A-like enzyme
MHIIFKIIFTVLGFFAMSATLQAQNDDDDFLITLLSIANQLGDDTPPNILFIIADDLGLDASNQYDVGAQKPLTPTLDQLANDGLVFDNFWTNPVCSPTRAAVITGRYGFRTGVLTPGETLETSETVIQQYIRNNSSIDYAMAVVGKWHLGNGNDHALDSGVEYFYGLAGAGGGVGSYTDWNLNDNGQTSQQTDYVTSVLTDGAIDWIDQQDKPWFLWLAYNAPHSPFHLPPQALHTQNLSGDQADIDNNTQDYYFAMIEAMDTEIARLLDSLPQAERDNTIIFYMGDNGTPGQVSQDPFSRGRAKGSLHQGGVNTPMFVTGKGVTRNGEREDALVNNTDLFATFAALAGVDVMEVNDSIRFDTLFSTDGPGSRTYIYTDVRASDDISVDWTVRDQQYKLINYADGSQELYDLLADDTEQDDFLSTGDTNSLVARIVDRLETIVGQLMQ